MPSPSTQEFSITLHGETTFEHVVRRLHLSPSQYATSTELKEWVRKNKDHKYGVSSGRRAFWKDSADPQTHRLTDGAGSMIDVRQFSCIKSE